MRVSARVCSIAAACLSASIAVAGAPKVGDPAPDVTAKDQNGKDVALGSFKGKSAVVLWFYRNASSDYDAKEGRALRDDMAKFEAAGARIVGVSMDGVAAQKAFAEKEGIKFPLLSDPLGKFAEAFGVQTINVYRADGREETISDRATFVIDWDGKIVYVNSKVDIAKQNAELLEVLGKK